MRLQILQHQLLRLAKLHPENAWDLIRVQRLAEKIRDEINWYKQTFELWKGIVKNN